MKKLLITLLLISPFSFADTGKTISLECRLTELGKHMYMDSEQYKNDYLEYLADFDDKSAERMALAFMRLHYEFTLKRIEVDKDVNESTKILTGGIRTGYEYKWKPDKLVYNNYFGVLWTYATIFRDDLSYLVRQSDMRTAKSTTYFDGKCKIIQLERKF